MIFLIFVAVTVLVVFALSHNLLLAFGAAAALWLASFLVLRRLIRFPPHYVYTKNTTRVAQGLTQDIRGNARKLWGAHINDPLTDLKAPFENIEVPVPETGHYLRGWYIPAQHPFVPASSSSLSEPLSVCVVCVHGAGRDRRAFLRHVPVFQRKGISVLLCDCREHGTSDGHGAGLNFGHRESVDVAATVRYARQQLKSDVVVAVGTSTGAVASILAAAIHGKRDPTCRVDGLCAENPFYSREGLLSHVFHRILKTPRVPGLSSLQKLYITLGLRMCLADVRRTDPDLQLQEPEDIIHEISPTPLLLIHGTADLVVPVAHTERLYELAKEPKGIWIAKDAEHTGLYDAHPDEWERRVLDLIYQSVEASTVHRK